MTDYLNPVLDRQEINAISVLGLAHIGDGVYELMVRTWLCEEGGLTSANLHKRTVKMVKAEAQAAAVAAVLTCLTEEEHDVFMRGRNAQPKTLPKNADRGDYAKATALEALFGYLYLNGQRQRLNELFGMIIRLGKPVDNK